ncbi:MAG: SAM-dependent methyltransferase [Planctomycetes bacterium]|nr:SAM-dependent methyltransferase [Planctomycetota bacterium]
MRRKSQQADKSGSGKKLERGKVSPAGTLRVLGGSLRGRPIIYRGDLSTRPMKQRVREAAFGLLGPSVTGSHVVDLFAGTGALTWEALSRGAASATLIERHLPTAAAIRENAQALNVVHQIELVTSDTFFWARRLPQSLHSAVIARHWLVFCSPPYDLYVAQREDMVALLTTMVRHAPPRSLLVVEADERFDMNLLPHHVTWDVRSYLPAVLAVGEIAADGAAER